MIVNKETTFEEMARTRSDCSSAAQGGMYLELKLPAT
jgi:hypothetical protein